MANEKRLIDANALKAEFTGNFHEMWHYTGIRAMIDVAPTVDAVEVVRCKDCKHWDWRENNPITVPYFCNAEALYAWGRPARNADDFCSYGERKSNGENM